MTSSKLNYVCVLLTCSVLLTQVTKLFAWGGPPHQHIVDGALPAIPAEDHISLRLGSESRHLRDTVEMGDWMNSLIVVQENWHVTTEDFPQIQTEYFGNDYLLFPAAPRFFNHMMPQVHETYAPFFLRALQALRTEDQANAARWIGSLLHFVTDSGSPPHTISLSGPNHTKMENWLDASKIDLRSYTPQLLGKSDAEAVEGLKRRMDALIARNAKIARTMVPYAEANDRAHVEPMALDCAEETARVTADVIHTLLVLTAEQDRVDSGSIVVAVTAPVLPENPLLPAKLILLGTSFSTLSSIDSLAGGRYAGTFSLRNIPAGTYTAAIERAGARTLLPAPITIQKEQQAHFSWQLQETSPSTNLVPNPDFTMRWLSAALPDHWRHEPACHCWLSDNIPVLHGNSYRVYVVPSHGQNRDVTIQWMAKHSQKTDDLPIRVPAAQNRSGASTATASTTAVYGRISIAGDDPPQDSISAVVVVPSSIKSSQ